MNKRIIISLFVWCFLCSSAVAEIRDLPSITIMSASSLTAPITELVRMYPRERNITVTASFNATSEQAWKIERGDSADIFIASHPYWMAELKQMGLIDVYSLTNLVKNKLTLVVAKSGRLGNQPIPGVELQDKLRFLNARTIMVVGDPNNSSLGLYTKQAVTALDKLNGGNLWQELSAKTLKSSSSKNNLYLTAKGETAGIVYYSEAHNNDEVDILSVIDENLHEPIIYQAAVVAGENMSYARDFLAFMQSDVSKQIFKKHGFVVD